VTRTRAQYQQKLIEIVMRAAHEDARHAEWLLERQFPHEFAPYDRRPIPVEPEPEDKKKINVAFIVNTGGKSLKELTSFPVISTEEAMARIRAGGRELSPGHDSGRDANLDELSENVDGDSPC
jgi:hypothetical protein